MFYVISILCGYLKSLLIFLSFVLELVIAALAHVFGVAEPVSVWTSCRQLVSAHLMVTRLAQALGIVLSRMMHASSDGHERLLVANINHLEISLISDNGILVLFGSLNVGLKILNGNLRLLLGFKAHARLSLSQSLRNSISIYGEIELKHEFLGGISVLYEHSSVLHFYRFN